ncbi:hypothetical protein R1flu_022201 [Riccia fluitans]|uniref:Uncharacterized protein n=1 Tax=Riccia fluitans TaxID=41844 RepID=A0ABD1ZRI3_9MARC
MAAVRAHQRVAHGLRDLQTDAVTRPTGTFVDIHVSLEWENDENLPMFRTSNVQDRAVMRRPSPRRPLQDITHLFPSNTFRGQSSIFQEEEGSTCETANLGSRFQTSSGVKWPPILQIERAAQIEWSMQRSPKLSTRLLAWVPGSGLPSKSKAT